MDSLDFKDQILDGKYQMTRELGRGGMGTVYLATHLGTERSVAVKIISPQFMQRGEFVERFRREARAAGRLRHPNVVDVTDFGFADTDEGQVAYLVMEYLDGCTLGEILEEEKNLPVGWTLDILEQVCSAVHEAHDQGIIHRDLKPDNIWLEPNQRGGYTVKVLDFGIAKLEEQAASDGANVGNGPSSLPTYASNPRITFGGSEGEGTIAGGVSSTRISEASTIAQTADHGMRAAEAGTIQLDPIISERETVILEVEDASGDLQDTIGTRVVPDQVETSRSGTEHQTTARSLYESTNSADLTRVGAVLGTPLYMSPEQCRGEHLDPRSDIYSLGVIAYQMLSGAPPFQGDFKDVMEAHKAIEPLPLRTKKVRRKMKKVIHSALAKDPEKRPQTAEAFASELRSRSEGIFGLLRRALVIYSEHLPKFLMLTTFFMLPVIFLTLLLVTVGFLKVSEIIPQVAGNVVIGVAATALSVLSQFCSYLIIGTNTWIVTQYLTVPLRPIRLRPALLEAKKKWKTFAGTGILSTLLTFLIGVVTCGIGFLVMNVLWMLVAPVVMMENLRGREALRRSRYLVKRSVATAVGAVCIIFLIPAVLAGTLSFVVNTSAKAFGPLAGKDAAVVQKQAENPDAGEQPESPPAEKKGPLNIDFGSNHGITINSTDMDMRSRVKKTILESLIQIFWLPLHIIVLSFSSIIVALLYLKTRLAGGESMNDLIERFEDTEQPRKKWQERVRQRLLQSGRIPSKP